MPRRRGVIGLEVQGLGRVVSAGKQVAQSFAQINFVLGGVRQSVALLEGAWDSLRGVLAGAGSDEAIAQTFARLTGGASGATAALDSLRGATRGLVSDTDLQVATNKALQSGLEVSTERLGDMYAATIAMGRATGKSAKESIDVLTQSLARNSDRGLKAIGLTVDFARAQDDAARALGISTTQLGEHQKRQILLQETMRSLSTQAAGFTDLQTPLADANDAVSAAFANMGSRINEILATSPGFVAGMQSIADSIVKISTAAAKALAELAPLFAAIAENPGIFGAIAGGVGGFVVSGFNPIGAAIGASVGGVIAAGGSEFGDQNISTRPADTRRLADNLAGLATAGSSRAQADVDRLAADLDARSFQLVAQEGGY